LIQVPIDVLGERLAALILVERDADRAQPFEGRGRVASALALDQIEQAAAFLAFVVVPGAGLLALDLDGDRPVRTVSPLALGRMVFVVIAEQSAADGLAARQALMASTAGARGGRSERSSR
jgi:hypothetical protein